MIGTVKQRIAVAALSLSAVGFVRLASYEGYEPVARPPVPGDVPTVGFGSTGPDIKTGDRTDPVRALARALTDVSKFEGALKQCVRVPLSQNEYDAYVSLAYNIGPGKEGVADGFCWLKAGGNSTLVRRLNAGDYEGACRAILDWNRFQGRVLQGLVNRRQREYAQCVGTASAQG